MALSAPKVETNAFLFRYNPSRREWHTHVPFPASTKNAIRSRFPEEAAKGLPESYLETRLAERNGTKSTAKILHIRHRTQPLECHYRQISLITSINSYYFPQPTSRLTFNMVHRISWNIPTPTVRPLYVREELHLVLHTPRKGLVLNFQSPHDATHTNSVEDDQVNPLQLLKAGLKTNYANFSEPEVRLPRFSTQKTKPFSAKVCAVLKRNRGSSNAADESVALDIARERKTETPYCGQEISLWSASKTRNYRDEFSPLADSEFATARDFGSILCSVKTLTNKFGTGKRYSKHAEHVEDDKSFALFEDDFISFACKEETKDFKRRSIRKWVAQVASRF